MENKMQLEDLYNNLGYEVIDELYMVSCLKASGVEDFTEIVKLLPILHECWLKDELNTSISTLSDLLVAIKDNIEIDKISTRELLKKMYEEYCLI